MTCTAVSTLKGSPQLPMLPSQPPTTSSGWQALRIIIQTILQQIQGAAGATGVNVIPQQYALFGASTLPPITATNCTVALDTSTVLFGVGSLKITITGANATVSFGTGFPVSPNASWLISFFTQASAQVAGSITITTPAKTYTTDFTSPTSQGWQRLYDTLNLVADDSTSFGVSFSFPSASGQTVWIDGSQMEPWSNVPMGPSPFISTSGALTVDNLPDGSTYARTLGSGLLSGHAAYTADSGGTIHLIKGVGDASTLGLDGEIADGTTYLRMPGANMDPNRRALIDFTQTGHLSKTIDYVGDGTTYARTLAGQLQGGIPLAHGDGNNVIPNPSFYLNTANFPIPTTVGGDFCDGWYVGEGYLSDFTFNRDVPAYSENYPGDAFISLNNGVTLTANQAIYVSLFGRRTIPVTPGDIYVVSAFLRWDRNTAFPSGMYSYMLAGLRFEDVNGNYISNTGAQSVNQGATGEYSATVTVPANAAYAVGIAQVYLHNGTGASWTATSGDVYIDARFMGLSAVRQTADLRQIPPLFAAGAQPVWENLTISYTAAAGSPATATISVSAAQVLGLKNAGALVSYNASSASVTGTGGTSVTYYLYYVDPPYSGATQTLYATTTGNDLRQQLGIVYIGSVVVAYPTTGSGSGSGTGGLCVADDMYVRPHRLAGAAQPGDEFDCVDFPTGQGKHVRKLLAVTRGKEQCVRLVAENGCALVCSISTPFDTVDGRELRAPDMMGETVLTDLGLSPLVKITPVGLRNVSRNHLGGVSYAAGELPDRRIYSHNTSTSKP